MAILAMTLCAGEVPGAPAAEQDEAPASASPALQSPLPPATDAVRRPDAPEPAAADYALPGQYRFVVPRGICESKEPVQTFPGRSDAPADSGRESERQP